MKTINLFDAKLTDFLASITSCLLLPTAKFAVKARRRSSFSRCRASTKAANNRLKLPESLTCNRYARLETAYNVTYGIETD